MTRTTKSDAYAAFIRLANALGKTVWISPSTMEGFTKDNKYYPKPNSLAADYLTMGSWHLNYAGCYGGYVIQEMDTPGGGISNPFDHRRMKAEEFYNAVNFALQLLYLQQRKADENT